MRIGTRGSALALAQARAVSELLGGGELVVIATRGDRGAPAEDKSRWVSELEQALAAGEVDIAVHSAKDVPGELGEGLELLGSPPRAAAEDVLCGAGGLEQLAPAARVGTSSLRRIAQLRSRREDVEVVPLHGNVDTRLRKLGDADLGLSAIVLARAGLQRLGRAAEGGASLDPARFVPAPGQGTLAIEGRRDDAPAREAVARISDRPTFTCLLAERALAAALGASCHTPLGAHARIERGALALRAWIGLPDGSAWLADELAGDPADPAALGGRVAERMLAAGAAELLAQAEGAAEHLPAGR